jgi:hypothetical protein
MQLFVWRGASSNFGDELNTLLWPRLLPGLFDEPGPELFLGIGSVLDARHPASRRKVVAGAGYGGYKAPARLDGTWAIHWVRGPRTARRLGLPAAFGLGDPASLVPLVWSPPPYDPSGPIGFMPHFESLARGAWRDIVPEAGLTLIDPRDEPGTVLARIARCRMVLTEALHGAIVADALRVPWVAVRPLSAIHRAKWYDWADSMDVTIAFRPLPPSTPREQVEARIGPCWTLTMLARLLQRGVRHRDRAVAALRSASAMTPQLSSPASMDRARNQMLDRIRRLHRPPARSPPRHHPVHGHVPSPSLRGPQDGYGLQQAFAAPHPSSHRCGSRGCACRHPLVAAPPAAHTVRCKRARHHGQCLHPAAHSAYHSRSVG